MTLAGPRSACTRGVRPGAPGCESRARPTPQRVGVCGRRLRTGGSPGDSDNIRDSTRALSDACKLPVRRRYGSDVQGVQQLVRHEWDDALAVRTVSQAACSWL